MFVCVYVSVLVCVCVHVSVLVCVQDARGETPMLSEVIVWGSMTTEEE